MQISNETILGNATTKVLGSRKSRNFGKDITGLTSTPEIQAVAGLDFKVVKMPMLIQGIANPAETRASKFKALVRTDNAVEIATCTDKYEPIQNAEIIDQFTKAAELGNMTMRRAGAYGHGKQVFCIADTTGTGMSFDLGDGRLDDRTVLQFVMVSGHEPGMSLIIKAAALRLVCGNGACVSNAAGMFRLGHRVKFGPEHAKAIRDMLERAIVDFATYESKARLMSGVHVNRAQAEAMVIELLQPSLLMAAVEKIPVSSSRPVSPLASTDYVAAGKRVLEHVMDREGTFEQIFSLKADRGARQVISVIDEQPGAELFPGTVWNTYNAVTYHVDHVRGRSEETGGASALFGEGDRLKTRALNLGVEYVGRLAAAREFRVEADRTLRRLGLGDWDAPARN
jgi:hypothetical protein